MPDPVDDFMESLTAKAPSTYPGTDKPIRTGPEKVTREQEQPHDDELDWRSMGKTYRFSGKEIEFFPIGALALALGKKPVTIRSWEQKGWLPESRFRGPHRQGEGRRRLYTSAFIKLVESIAREEGVWGPDPKHRMTDTQFVERVKEALK